MLLRSSPMYFAIFFSKIEELFTVFLLILCYVSLIYRLHVVEPLHSHGSKVFKLHLRFSEYWLEPLRTLPLEHMINARFLGWGF